MRSENYGKIDLKNMSMQVRNLWYSKNKELPELPQIDDMPAEESSSLDDVIRAKELVAKVFKMLPPKDRQLLHSLYILEKTLSEVAQERGLSITRIGQMRNAAARKFRYRIYDLQKHQKLIRKSFAKGLPRSEA